LIHHANPKFWAAYDLLPEAAQRLADRNLTSCEVTIAIRRCTSNQSIAIGLFASASITGPWQSNPVTISSGSGSVIMRNMSV
jgi:hypothetical protein